MPQLRRDAAGEPILDPVLDFLRLLWSIEHRLQSTSKRMGTTLGITAPQRLVLRIVSQYPDISAGELAHVVRLHPSTITGILQRLVAKGLWYALLTRPTPAASASVSASARGR
jgi:predicted ArsR family transcriptional regulator